MAGLSTVQAQFIPPPSLTVLCGEMCETDLHGLEIRAGWWISEETGCEKCAINTDACEETLGSKTLEVGDIFCNDGAGAVGSICCT